GKRANRNSPIERRLLRNLVLRKRRRHELGELAAFGIPGHAGALDLVEPQPGNWFDPDEHSLSAGHNGDARSPEGKTLRFRDSHRQRLAVLDTVRIDL